MSKPCLAAALAAALLALAAGARMCSPASAALSGKREPRARTQREVGAQAQAKAPSGPPLTSGASASAGEESATALYSAQADPLVSNGLGSPTCKAALVDELSQAGRRHCETSGFVAAPAPTGNYGLDVHINTGVLGIGANAVASVVQDFLITPLWMALVWAVHALVVMLEWCFSIDLLQGSGAIGLGSGLRATQASFTEPWLALALACASVLSVYHGLIRRRVAQTLGEVLLTGAMMAGGLWIISDPLATVGALGQWADQASMGVLAVASSGSPARPVRRLGSGLEMLFTNTIEGPWCYLEFGEVSWCREPSQLDPRLRAAGLKIAEEEDLQVACEPGSEALTPCVRASPAQQQLLERSAELLRDARTNGELFLALPANGVARNSINEDGSLLHVLCASSEATNCRGPTAAQAEFRTQGPTLARLGGLLLIAGGLLGMLLLLGFLAVRLLIAAVLSLLLLVLAPAVVLVPAFGQAGRDLFRRWAARLFGALVSKLVFSFLLGAVLAVLSMLASLTALGWWTQWLLTSAFWWAAYLRRHELLLVSGQGERGSEAGRRGPRRSLARRVSNVLDAPLAAAAATRWAQARLSRPAPEARAPRRREPPRSPVKSPLEDGLDEVLAHEQHSAHARVARAPAVQRELESERSRLARIERERAGASAAGNHRRASALRIRGERLRASIDARQNALEAAQRIVRDGQRAPRRRGQAFSEERRVAWQRFIEAQAALPSASVLRRGGEDRRDYAGLAGLAGLAREQYEELAPQGKRAARLTIDRELAARRELAGTARSLRVGKGDRPDARTSAPGYPGGPREGAFDRRPQPRARARSGVGGEGSRAQPPGSPARPRIAAPAEASSVMRDAHAVAEGRKRQLGRDRA